MEQNISSSSNLNFEKIPRKGSSKSRFFSDHFYLSHPEIPKTLHAPCFIKSLKKVSLKDLQADFNKKLNTNISFIEDEDLDNELYHSDEEKEDIHTQTSKTILELARLENGQMTPDSLNSSPKNVDSQIKQITESSEENIADGTGDKKHSNFELTFMRKNYIKNFTSGDNISPFKFEDGNYKKSNDLEKRYSLIERFFSKKNFDKMTTSTENRSNSLQRTSPLHNLLASSNTRNSKMIIPQFKNECKNPTTAATCIPNYIPDDEIPNTNFRPSRFVIKKVKNQKEDDEKNSQLKLRIRSISERSGCRKRTSSLNICRKKTSTYMSPTLASEQKSKLPEVKTLTSLIPSPRRGRTLSSSRLAREVVEKIHNISFKKVPYIDQSNYTDSSLKSSQEKLEKNIDAHNSIGISQNEILQTKYSQESVFTNSKNFDSCSISSSENVILAALSHLRKSDWSIALKGLAELTELCKSLEPVQLQPHMTKINQRLIELLRSPRSHVCRTACQAAGHFFEYIKDTRRPEFDDLVNILLGKTADSSKFIRKDANLALDCMVTHISTFHSIRVITAQGPEHKNCLVRVATARLLVCAVVIAGPNAILNTIGNDGTRKRVFNCLVRFIQDKSPEVR